MQLAEMATSEQAGDCPPDEAIAAWLDGRAAVNADRIAAHLAGCDFCRDVASDLALDGAVEHAPAPGPEPRRAWWEALIGLLPRPLVVVAPALVLVVAVSAVAAPFVWLAVRSAEQAAPEEAPAEVRRPKRRAVAPRVKTAPAPEAAPAEPPAVIPEPIPQQAPVAPATPRRPRATERAAERPVAPPAAAAPVEVPSEEAASPAPVGSVPSPREEAVEVEAPPAPQPVLEELLREAESSLAAGRLEDAAERLTIVSGAGPNPLLKAKAQRLHQVLVKRWTSPGKRVPADDPCELGYVLEVVESGPNTTIERCVMR